MNTKAAAIINPKSHAVATRESIFKELDVVSDETLIVELNDFAELPMHIDRLMQNACKLIFIEGGDGTIVAVLSECLAVAKARKIPLPKFAILAGGSTNLAYKILGFGSRRRRALKGRIAKYLKSEIAYTTKQHRLLRITTSEADEPVVGFLLSTGSLARVMMYTERQLDGARRGGFSVAKAIFQIGFRPQSTLFEDGLPIIRPNFFR